jgi:apolipoprotein D and lipocalin family protein
MLQKKGGLMFRWLIAMIGVLGLVNFIHATDEQTLQTVSHVDLKRYMGTWYEIARSQNPWQGECAHNTTATYTLNPDGTILVKNQCQTGSKPTDVQVSNGTARVVDSATNAKLKITFSAFETFKWEFSGDYWIILLDKEYQYAAVSEPTQKYLWILSRTPALSEDLYTNILSHVAVKMPNLNVLDVLRTKQDGNPFDQTSKN